MEKTVSKNPPRRRVSRFYLATSGRIRRRMAAASLATDATALRLFRLLAHQGDPNAQYRLQVDV